MNCPLMEELLSCYVDGVLDEESASLVERHVEGCPDCRQALEALRVIAACSAHGCEDEMPSELRADLRQMAARAEVCARLADEVALGEAQEHVTHCGACADEAAFYSRYAAAAANSEVLAPEGLRAAIAAATYDRRSWMERLLRPVFSGRAAWSAGAALVLVAAIYGTIDSTRRPSAPPPPASSAKAADTQQAHARHPDEDISPALATTEGREMGAATTTAAVQEASAKRERARLALNLHPRSVRAARNTARTAAYKPLHAAASQVAALPVPKTPERSGTPGPLASASASGDTTAAGASGAATTEPNTARQKPLVVVRVEPEDLIARNSQIDLTADIQRRVRERKHRALADISPEEPALHNISIKLWEAKF